MLYDIIYKKSIEEIHKKIKYNKVFPKHNKYFLLCRDCFWMASTLPHLSNTHTRYFDRCPKCEDRLDKFLICNDEVI